MIEAAISLRNLLQHVSLECRRADAEAHAAFWTALGFAPVATPESLGDRAAWYERAGTQIHLLWSDAPTVPAQGHVAVRVDDLDALGLELDERTPHWGERRAYATAPGGHVVEVFEVGPQSHS